MTHIQALLTTLFAPPTFADEDKTRVGRLLHVYLQLNFWLTAVSLLIVLVFMPHLAWLPLSVMALTCVVLTWLRRGYFVPIGIIGLLVLGLVFYASNVVVHEMYGPGTLFCIVFIIAGGFIYGERGLMIVFALASVLLVAGAGLHYASLQTNQARQQFAYDTAIYVFAFAFVTLTVAIALQAFNHALARARKSERALKEVNTELEQRIQERTEQLSQSEWHYRSLIESTSDMVSIVWPDGIVAYQSPSLERMLGYKPAQVVGLNVFDVVHPEDVAPTQAILQGLVQSDAPSHVFEARFRHMQGHWVFLEMTGRVMREGRLPGSIVITSRDVTERKQNAQIIQRQAESEHLIADISGKFARMAAGEMDATINFALQKAGSFIGVDVCRLFLLDEHSVQLTNTHEWCAPGIPSRLHLMQSVPFYQEYNWWHQQLLAYKVIHVTALDELPPAMDSFLKNLQQRGVKSLVTVPLMRGGKLLGEIGFDALQQTKTWAQDDIRLLRVVSEMIVSVLDRERIAVALKAERNLLEERVAQRTSELSKLIIENARLHEHEVQAAALTERSRLARELHDSVSQALFGIVLGSRTLMQKAGDTPDLLEPTNYVMRLADAALAEMRALIFELRPESLQQEGLIAAFQKQAEALCARHQIKVTTHLGQAEPQLPIEAKEALYRIGLEAIQNTLKHAKATHVQLNLAVNNKTVSLEVCDDGIGFNSAAHYPGHLGLVSMRERAEKCGGSFDIGSQRGRGTAVRVQLPVDCACR